MKADAALVRERSSGWRFVVGLLLIAFTLQSYITQTHIHNAAPASITQTISHSHGKAPGDDNPMDCPFCQAVAHDGPFFLPAAPLLILSFSIAELAAPTFRIHLFRDAPAHVWQSRAPPHH